MTAILTADEMRRAEAASGVADDLLMLRAGAALAEATLRFAGPLPTLVLAGPGNNGGDGYVAARLLATRGVSVRVAAVAPPRAGSAAERAAASWTGPVETLAETAPATIVIDALFGTGLARPLDAALAAEATRLLGDAAFRVAADLPSGVASDDGAVLTPLPPAGLTVAFGALKPAHLLQPAAATCGRLVVADIGVAAESALRRIEAPAPHVPGPTSHKYSRGMVAVIGGAMPGAAALASEAAARGGAGYVLLLTPDESAGTPHAIVRRRADAADLPALLDDARIGALLIGPGLGRDADARARLGAALAGGRPLVIDGDALALLTPERIARAGGAILTPHEGEFARLFGDLPGSKVARARKAATRAGAVVLLKGADSVVAAPDGRAAILPPHSHWLATAGTGDVLAGLVAARLAGGDPPFEAAQAGAWLHADAARIAGPGLIADDLLAALKDARR